MNIYVKCKNCYHKADGGSGSVMPDLQATLAVMAGGATASSGTDDSRRKHECPECGKRFPTPSKLQRHSFIHTGEKPYNCQYCPKSYSQLVHLKNHLMSHEKEFAAAAAASASVKTEVGGGGAADQEEVEEEDETIEIPDQFEEGEAADLN